MLELSSRLPGKCDQRTFIAGARPSWLNTIIDYFSCFFWYLFIEEKGPMELRISSSTVTNTHGNFFPFSCSFFFPPIGLVLEIPYAEQDVFVILDQKLFFLSTTWVVVWHPFSPQWDRFMMMRDLLSSKLIQFKHMSVGAYGIFGRWSVATQKKSSFLLFGHCDLQTRSSWEIRWKLPSLPHSWQFELAWRMGSMISGWTRTRRSRHWSQTLWICQPPQCGITIGASSHQNFHGLVRVSWNNLCRKPWSHGIN